LTNRKVERRCTMLGECAHNIALGHYAGQTPSRAENDDCTDAVCGKQLCRHRETGSRFDRDDVAAQVPSLGGQDRLDVHGSLPETRSPFKTRSSKYARSHRDDPRVRATCNDPARPPVPSTRNSVRSAPRGANWLMWRCSSVLKLGKIRLPIEPREQQQPSQKSPDMRLPRNRLLTAGH